ncbi:MAG: hypothetical protein HYZ28_10945 [Myxococcales bacterium]|nr:hypothetical protein [Myxococcales bacterium]
MYVAVAMSNYFHDVATAMLICAAALLWAFHRRLPADAGPQMVQYYLGAYASLRRLMIGTIAFICAAGVPRVLFFKELDGRLLDDPQLRVAIIAKHVLVVAALVTGTMYWVAIRRKATALRAGGPGSVNEAPMPMQ